MTKSGCGLGAQAAIAENAQLFEEIMNGRNYNESILKSLSNGVITLNAERAVIKVNEAALKILHTREQDIIERPASELFAGNSGWILECVQAVARSGTTDLTLDSDLTLPDGATVSVNLAVVPLVNVKNEPIGSMLIFEDISSEKRVKSTMARYMSKDVVDKLIAEGGDTLIGSDQEVTVLFSDIEISRCRRRWEPWHGLHAQQLLGDGRYCLQPRRIPDKYIGVSWPSSEPVQEA